MQSAESGRDLEVEGLSSRSLVLVLDGWACRYKQLEDGRRQIISLFVPGDLSEPFGTLPSLKDSSIGALTPVTYARLQPEELQRIARENAGIHQALWWDLLVTMSMQDERVVSLGRRSASERLGHLFCELCARLDLVGLAEGNTFDMPMTQADLGDLLGLSTVHVNRSLQELRGSGLISLRNRRLIIHDVEELGAISLFDPAYLHVGNGLPASQPGRSTS
ncbi:Crp/Fnr family transcriptional regulator [Terrihabitans rhizophilus]|uniref:Crp/Fnr family transcriptional regulator n=1 Tax=Terrihabitans rhizophilus TaxID=3092662 RepID=UPI0029DE56D9|nr:Crp/Fnr family transcriptional regulator [Terrihabitans sp. PJ23]